MGTMDTGGIGIDELSKVLGQYNLGAVRECSPLRRGSKGGRKLLIYSENGVFVLKQRVLGRDDPYKVAMSHDVQLYLTHKGYPLPKLVGTRHSQSTMWRTDRAIFEIYNYVDGQNFDGSRHATVSAGYWLWRFHEVMTDYQPTFEIPRQNFHNNRQLRKEIQEIPHLLREGQPPSRNNTSHVRISETLLGAYNEAALAAKDCGHDSAGCVICHGDWHPGNLIFRDRQVIAVLDYDSVRLMPAMNDAAIGCLQFSLVAKGKSPADWPDYFDTDRIQWFLAGYRPTEFWSDQNLMLLRALMIEALIAEAMAPVAATGRFESHHGGDFLGMIVRKVKWLGSQGIDLFRPR